MVATLVKLKWRLTLNALTKNVWAIIGTVFGALYGIGAQQAGGHRQAGRLARPVGADDAVEAGHGDVEAQSVHRDLAIEDLDQPPHLKRWNGGGTGSGPDQCANRVCAVGRAHRAYGSRHVSTVKALPYSALRREEEITVPAILPENRPEHHQSDEEGAGAQT